MSSGMQYIEHVNKIQECLPLLKEMKQNIKKANKVVKDIPEYVPKFGEMATVIDYDFDKVQFEENIASDWAESNPIRKLGLYDHPVAEKMYDDIPGQYQDFDTPHMGIFNNDHYCDEHDNFVINNPSSVLDKLYYVSDYHQMSLIRMFVLGRMGKDVMPKICKNMNRVNFYQRLYPIDIRSNFFVTKKAGWHTYHEIGRHYGCFGQVYNHIPGHGFLIRKDLLSEAGNDWIKKWEPLPQCFNKSDVFPESLRLYDAGECKEFFADINSADYKQRQKDVSPILYVIKVGFGVHRGAGVFILDEENEKYYRELYENGEKCGEVDDNLIAQRYIHNPLTVSNGHKFDFRIYMMIASVNPLIVYYFDGFLRVSMSKYDKNSTEREVHLTNTELYKEKIKESCKDPNNPEPVFMGMTCEELRNFQMRTLEAFHAEMMATGKVTDPNWLDTYLRPQFQRAFIHAAKMVHPHLYKSSNLYEMFGVDFVIDEDFNLFVIEVNASPMIIGTSREKTKLMKKMFKDLVDIERALVKSRTKRVLNFLGENKAGLKSKDSDKILELRGQFDRLHKNYLESEYEGELKGIGWTKVLDESKEDGRERFNGLIDEQCWAGLR
jgi:hypothetical protein